MAKRTAPSVTAPPVEPSLAPEGVVTSGIDLGPNGLLEAGSTAEIVADMFPARISPKPAALPNVTKMRVVITDQTLTIAWPGGFQNGIPVVHRYDVRINDADNASFRGGEVVTVEGDTFVIERGNGCACGAAGLKTWHPFPQVNLTQRAKTVVSTGPQTVGAVRYSRG